MINLETLNLEMISLGITAVVGLAGIIGVVFTARQNQKAILTGTYFTEMTSAYAGYITAINNFVYNRDNPRMRDELSASLFLLQLFATPEIDTEAQAIYVFLLTDWVRRPERDSLELDMKLQILQDSVKADLERFRKKGHH